MKAIVIKRQLSGKELSSVIKKAGEGDLEIYSTVALPSNLFAYNKGAFEITEEEKKRINYECMEYVLSFGEKIFEGKPVVEWLKFDDSSIWYYHKFRVYFLFRNLKYEILEAKKLSEAFDSVIFYTSENYLPKESLQDNITFILPSASSGKNWNLGSFFKFFMILKTRWLINIFSYKKLKHPEHIIMDVSKRQTFLDPKTLEEKRGNFVIGYLLEKAGDDFLIMEEAIQPKMSDGARISLSRDHLFGKGSLKHRYFGEPILLNYIFFGNLRRRKKQFQNNIYESLQTLDRICTEEDGKLLIRIYKSLRGATNYFLIKYLAYKKFFSKHAFKTISTVDENSPALRCILDAARIAGIHTIGLQHGNIHDLHPAYLYTSSDSGRKAFPDHSIVWGKYWKEFLVSKGHYIEDNIGISGQVRTDIIPQLMAKNINKEDVVREIKFGEKLIVFASQPQRDPLLRRRAAEDVIKAVKATTGVFLFIKLHPNEKDDVEYYANIAKDAGLDRICITLSVDLYLLISVCDILITCFSTVGTETVYFGKPLIILDHLKQDIQNYHKEGVAFQATNAKELEIHIAGILNEDKCTDKESYVRFISKYALAIDGKAVERVLGMIRRW